MGSLINCFVDKERIMKVFSLTVALFMASAGAEDLFEKEGWLELKKYFECGCQANPGVLGGSATTAMSSCTKTHLDSGDDVFLHKRAFTPADLESVARTVETGDGKDYDNSCFWIHPWIYENYRNGRRINLNGRRFWLKLYATLPSTVAPKS